MKSYSSELINKAVIPAAGLGTRMGAMTRAVPKELLPLVDRPALDWIIEECIDAGTLDIAIITSEYKKPLFERHLDGKFQECSFTFMIQGSMNGLGGAVLCAEDWAGDDCFAILLPDDLVLGENSTSLLKKITLQTGLSTIAITDTPDAFLHLYGVAGLATDSTGGSIITHLVEKPERGKEPSTFSITGRYMLTPEIWPALKKSRNLVLGEFQLTAGLDQLAKRGRLRGVQTNGIRCDLGNPASWLRANNLYSQNISQGKPDTL